MAANDQFYTPSYVARDVLHAITKGRVRVLADFAAGNGALLDLVTERWSKARVVANDYDAGIARALRRAYPAWQVSCCDFVNPRSTGKSQVLQSVQRKCDVVVLNPPFSYRGWQSWPVKFAERVLRCTRALTFVLRSIDMLGPGGQLIAVLPAGCLSTRADSVAWEAIDEFCNVEIMQTYGKRTFVGCFPRTILVRITKRGALPKASRRSPSLLYPKPRISSPVRIVRGWIPLHKAQSFADPAGIPLVHSTDLSADGICTFQMNVSSRRVVSGPAVLIPRVGQPSTENIAVLNSAQSVALSDCVIALCAQSEREAQALQTLLFELWPTIAAAYSGTCASYITLSNLEVALRSCGVPNALLVTPSALMAVSSAAQIA
ncbi:MAG: N-6 DNA methylase [Bryobacterales bacterium]|nr:N-6 DNA methylase [Bryobacterales bacterium]